MSRCLCTGAVLRCSFGLAPAVFSALPAPRVLIGGRPAGVLTDAAPLVNLPPFGLCQSPANPAVAAAPAAAPGGRAPMPCLPAPAGPWLLPSPAVLIGGRPAVTDGSAVLCAWGGQITVQFAGQAGVELSGAAP